MRIKKTSLLIVSIIIVALIIIYNLYFQHDHNVINEIIFPPQLQRAILKQTVNKRILKQIKVETITTCPQFKKAIFQLPIGIKERNNKIYILDVTEASVYSFDLGLKPLKSWGNGKGRGPGELLHPYGFDVSANGNVIIADVGNQMIFVFDKNNKLIESIKAKNHPLMKVAVLNDSEFVVDFGRGDINKIGIRGNTIQQYPFFFNQKLNMDWYEDLTLCRGAAGEIYGAFSHGGYLFGFSPNGARTFLAQTVDRFPFAQYSFQHIKINNKIKKYTSIDRNASISARYISYYSDTLYIQPGTALTSLRKKREMMLDVYSALSGKYLFSYIFKKPRDVDSMVSCAVYGNYIYSIVLCNDGYFKIAKYKIIK